MSSTNITQSNGKKIEERQSSDQNDNEEQAPSCSTRTKTFQKTAVLSNSLSSLDELLKLNKDELYNLKIIENSKSLNDLSEIQKPKEDAPSSIKAHISVDMTNIFGSERCRNNSNTIEQKTSDASERFRTVADYQIEETASINIPIIYPDNTRRTIIIVRSDYTNEPPPSYEYSQRAQSFTYQGMPGQIPAYQTPNMGYHMGMAQDPSRTPPFRRGDIHIDTENVFETQEIRNKFVRRVYLILAVQLLFTFGFITLSIYEIGLLCLMLVLFCYTQARRTYPFNFILLSLLTLCMAYLMAALSCFYDTKIVMISMGATGGICTLISILAWQHWFDITNYGTIIYIAFFIVVSYGLFAAVLALVTGLNISYLVFAGLITLLFCVYLMYDTQKILGGRRIEISPEEYVLGAITLYVDVMIIFHYLIVLATHCR